MDLAQALQDALYIFEEERLRPTLSYRYVAKEWPKSMTWEEHTLKPQGYSPAMAAITGLGKMRGRRPREVEEDPKAFQFESVNFNLLLTIMNQLAAEKRAEFVAGLVNVLLKAAPINRHANQIPFPSWNHETSSLSLLAEFCIRNGYAQTLLDDTLQLKMPSAGVAIMLMEIEEIIALNYNLFSRAEIDNLPKALARLREVADLQTWSSKRQHGRPEVKNPQYRQGYSSEGAEIVKIIDAITQQCNQARYFYLKGVLQQDTNLEVESDKTKVIGFLGSLGFDPILTASLAKAEDLYRASSDAFDLKSCLGHMRSFYEQLNIDAGQAIAKNLGVTVVDDWNSTLIFLANKSFLSPQQDKFARGLYTLLSDEGVHALIAEREFARLLRNVVIEYGLMFLTMFAKKGVKIQASNP
jgi:hypothetical protein